jgi:cell wall-associated NlpC family hydrolase
MTWQPTQEMLDEILALSAERAPLEACGVIVDNGSVIEVANKATDKHVFVMDAGAYAAAIRERSLTAVWHSHVYQKPTPSEGDRAMCGRGKVPWLIVSWPTGMHEVVEPDGFIAPLVGRTWCWGTLDCYGLVRDTYKVVAKVELPDFHREWLWWENGQSLLVDHYAEAGFVRQPYDAAPKNLDVLFLQIRGDVPNHCGIYLDEMGGVILHHLMDRLSMRERYAGFYHRHTTHILRHRSMM